MPRPLKGARRASSAPVTDEPRRVSLRPPASGSRARHKSEDGSDYGGDGTGADKLIEYFRIANFSTCVVRSLRTKITQTTAKRLGVRHVAEWEGAMLDELRNAILDSSTSTGLSSGFIENMSAEAIGVIAGIFISFLAAFLLDKIGNNRQFKPLRHRAAIRLVRLHEELVRELRKPFQRDRDNAASVRMAISELEDIVEEYDFGLTTRQMSAVNEYRSRLRALEAASANALRRGNAVQQRFRDAAVRLKPALKRLNSGRLEGHWKEVLGANLEYGSLRNATSNVDDQLQA